MAPAATSSASGGCLARHGGLLVAAGAPPLHPAVVRAAPARFGTFFKAGRLVMVAARAAAPASGPEGEGGDDNRAPSSGEEVVSKFLSEMEAFRLSYCPLILLDMPSSEMTVEVAYGTSMDCAPMLEFLLSKETVHEDILEDLVLAGRAFLTIEQQAKQGYLRADPLINAIQGMKLIGIVFFKGQLDYKVPVLPSGDDDIDKESFFRELVMLFVMHRSALYAEARKKYSYGARRAYDDLPSDDCQRAVWEFQAAMDRFKAPERAAAVIGRSDKLDTACNYAKKTLRMLEFLLAQSTVHRGTRIPPGFVAAGQALLIIVIQAEHQYIEADALHNAIQGLKMLGRMLFDVDLADDPPLTPGLLDLDRSTHFACLFHNFFDKTDVLCSHASKMYGFPSGAN